MIRRYAQRSRMTWSWCRWCLCFVHYVINTDAYFVTVYQYRSLIYNISIFALSIYRRVPSHPHPPVHSRNRPMLFRKAKRRSCTLSSSSAMMLLVRRYVCVMTCSSYGYLIFSELWSRYLLLSYPSVLRLSSYQYSHINFIFHFHHYFH